MSPRKDEWAQVSDALSMIFTAVLIGLTLVVSVFGFFLFTARNTNRTTHD